MTKMFKCAVICAALVLGCSVSGLSAAMSPAEITMLSNAAQRGNDGAQLLLAYEYLHGDSGLQKNEKQAVYWFEKAATLGNVAAQKTLGDLYEQGRGVPKNMKLSADWRRKAAERGNTEAQLSLGKMYLAGDGVPKDVQKAESWLKRAAIEGNAEAQFQLGKLYKARDSDAREQALAGNLLANSASQGYGSANEFLTFMENARYKLGELVHQHPADIHKLAEDGDADSQYRLATRYESGHGEAQDNAKALFWFNKAATNGNLMAMKSLAHIYTNGLDGVRRDPKLAQYWADQARAQQP
jgi:hypothetical protein